MARLVEIKGQPHLSLTLRKATADETKNLPLGEVNDWLQQLLGNCFRSALLATTQRDWQLSLSDGKPPRLISHKPSHTKAPARSHDQARQDILDESANDWLQGLGFVGDDGKVRARMADKHRQINRYLELFTHLARDCGWIDAAGVQAGRVTPCAPVARHEAAGSGLPALPASVGNKTPLTPALSPRPTRGEEELVIADMGCGKGYLTFGLWHLFQRLWQRPVRVIGVEARPELVAFTSQLAQSIQADGLEFISGSVENCDLPKLDALIALHACNTATDAAILKGIEHKTQLIIVAPCCHKEVRPQLTHPEPMDGILRHGLMQERLAEWLTDGLRSMHLEWAGYRTKMIEFVSGEHTPKNLMIAGVRTGEPFRNETVRQRIVALKSQFGIKRQSLDRLLDQGGPANQALHLPVA